MTNQIKSALIGLATAAVVGLSALPAQAFTSAPIAVATATQSAGGAIEQVRFKGHRGFRGHRGFHGHRGFKSRGFHSRRSGFHNGHHTKRFFKHRGFRRNHFFHKSSLGHRSFIGH